MSRVSTYAEGPSEEDWTEVDGRITRGRYCIERESNGSAAWVLRILHPGLLRGEPAPSGPHATKSGAKAWASHYDTVNIRRLKLVRHAIVAILAACAAVVLFDVSVPAESDAGFVGVLMALGMLLVALRELAWFMSLGVSDYGNEEDLGRLTAVDRAVRAVVLAIMRPVDEEAPDDDPIRVVELR